MSRLTISILAVSSTRNLFSRSNREREREREARVKKVSEFDEISMDVYFSYIFERGKKSIVDVGGETMRKR